MGLRRFADAERGSLFAFWVRRAFAGTLSPHPYQGAALNLPKGLIPLETLLLPRGWYGG